MLEPAQAAVAAGSSSERPSSTLGIYGGIGVPLKGNRGVYKGYTGFIPGLYRDFMESAKRSRGSVLGPLTYEEPMGR